MPISTHGQTASNFYDLSELDRKRWEFRLEIWKAANPNHTRHQWEYEYLNPNAFTRIERIDIELSTRQCFQLPDVALGSLPKLMTAKEASSFLTVSLRYVRTLIKRGEIASFKLGRCVRIEPTAIWNYLNRNKRDAWGCPIA